MTIVSYHQANKLCWQENCVYKVTPCRTEMDSGCYGCRSSRSSTTSKNLSHNLISTFCFQFIFSFSADQIYYHRSNCWFHSTQFSFITGCLFHSFLTRVKMLDGSVKTNYQVTDLQIVMCKTPWSANIHSLHKSDPRPSSFPFQSVGNTNWHTRDCFSHWNQWEHFCALQRVQKDVQSKHIHFTVSPMPIFWPASGTYESQQKRARFWAVWNQTKSVIFGRLHKRQEVGDPFSASAGCSAGPKCNEQARLQEKWKLATWGTVSFLL